MVMTSKIFAAVHRLAEWSARAVLASTTLFITEPASSQETAPFAQLAQIIHRHCGEKEGFLGGIAICVYQEEEEYGKVLAAEYNKALQQLPTSAQARLRESQRAWLVYQKTYCDLLRDLPSITFEGPGFAALARANCLLRTTLERLDAIQIILKH